MRNTSLAKNVMLYECTKNKFAKNISDSLIKGKPEEAKQRLSDLKIPDFLKEHYLSITKFYKENGNEAGAMTNLTFHSILTSVSQYGKSSIKDDPKGIKEAELLTSVNTAIKSVYSPKIPWSDNSLGEQIPGYTQVPVQVEVSAKPIEMALSQGSEPVKKEPSVSKEKSNPTSSRAKVASAINSFIDKAKEFISITEKSAASVTQNIQNPVITPVRPKSDAPEKVVRTAIDIIPISRHRSSAAPEHTPPTPLTSGVIEQAKALHPVTNTTSSSKPIIGKKHRDPQPPER